MTELEKIKAEIEKAKLEIGFAMSGDYTRCDVAYSATCRALRDLETIIARSDTADMVQGMDMPETLKAEILPPLLPRDVK